MLSYLLPFILLTFLAYLEVFNKVNFLVRNKFLYYSIILFFILFIGFRYQVGCDWESYEYSFKKISMQSFSEILTNQKKIIDLPYSLLSKILSITFNYKSIFVAYSFLFLIPFFLVNEFNKRKYLSLMISYPYYFLVIGMGPIRQAAAISFFMLSLFYISQNRLKAFSLSTILSSLFHNTSLIMNIFLYFIYQLNFLKKNMLKIFYFLGFILLLLLIYNFPFIYLKLKTYIYLKNDQSYVANSAILMWFLNKIAASIFIFNKSKFNFSNNLKIIFTYFSILEFILLPLVFINSVIAYRLLLYWLPINIYIISNMIDFKFFQDKKDVFIYSISSITYASLIIWLKYANHAYCWLPYRNSLFLN